MSGGADLVYLAVVVLLVCLSVRPVPPGHVYVVELLRRYRRTLTPGVNLIIPLLESVRAKVPMGQQTATFGSVPAVTSDDVVTEVSCTVHHHVVDPVRAAYEVHDRAGAVEATTGYVLRDLAGSMTLDQLRTNLHETSARLTERLDAELAAFGVQVLGVEITAIEEGSRRDTP